MIKFNKFNESFGKYFYNDVCEVYNVSNVEDDFGAIIGDAISYIKEFNCNAQNVNSDILNKDFGKIHDCDYRLSFSNVNTVELNNIIVLKGEKFDGIKQYKIIKVLYKENSTIITVKCLNEEYVIDDE